MQIDDTDFLQSSRIQELKNKINNTDSENEKRKFLVALTREIINSINDIASQKFDDGVMVGNFDEVTAALRNELARANKPLTYLLKELNISAQQQNDLISNIESKSQSDFKNEFQPVFLKKQKQIVHIDNLDEIGQVEDVSVNNLSEIEKYFVDLANSIKGSLNINIPEPKVTINPPQINIPQTQVNIPEANLQPLVDAIESVEKSLKVLKTNNKSNPLAVRLTDGSDWIKQLIAAQKQTSQAVAAFAGGNDQIRLLDVNRAIINPAQQEAATLKAFANISASTTDGSIVTASTGKIIRVTSVAAVAGATATTLTFNSKPGGSGTAITALFANGANGGMVLPYNPRGWFDTNISEGLTATTGSGSATGIQISYILV